MGIRDFSVVEALNASLGRMDFVVVTNGTVTAPAGQVFNVLVAHTASSFSATSKSGDNLPNASLQANSVRIGRFTSVTETSGGKVLAYYSPEGA